MEENKKLLKLKGLKATPARLLILSAFSKDCDPINAYDIFKRLKKQSPDLATIYRNLNMLEITGILKKIDLHADSEHYELNHNHHHHIICITCGTTDSFDGCQNMKLPKKN